MRFIPACAGNALSPGSEGSHNAVHPRVCGERVRVPTGLDVSRGSSPRVRGTQVMGRSQLKSTRFHPRVCGERARVDAGEGQDGGSSPRVRGTHVLALEKAAPLRFIPACAGNALTTLTLRGQ